MWRVRRIAEITTLEKENPGIMKHVGMINATIRLNVNDWCLEAPRAIFITPPECDHLLQASEIFLGSNHEKPAVFLDTSFFISDAFWKPTQGKSFNLFWSNQSDLLHASHHLSNELWATRSAMSSALYLQRCAHQAGDYSTEHWIRLISGLLHQFENLQLKVDLGLLCRVLELVEKDARKAYQQLAAAFQRVLMQREARIQRQLRVLSKLLAIFHSLLQLSFSIRNLVTRQRSWFLYHGSHPSDTLLDSRSGYLRGCIPAFVS